MYPIMIENVISSFNNNSIRKGKIRLHVFNSKMADDGRDCFDSRAALRTREKIEDKE